MVEYLRGLGIGLISLLGVAVPGSLLIMLMVFGLIIPGVCITLNLMGADFQFQQPLSTFSIWVTIWAFATLSYVVGYILRLTSPNDLDKASVERREKRGKTKSRVGFTDASFDKFPYNGIGTYLEEVGHNELFKLIPWKQNKINLDPKCDNSHVNKWKDDIELYCPKLSAAVDFEEAHIRLMSGTWLAIRTAWFMVFAGLLLTIAAFVLPLTISSVADTFLTLRQNGWYYLTQSFLNIIILFSM